MSQRAPLDTDQIRDLLGDWARPGAMLSVGLADAITRQVEDGTLPCGSRLPPAYKLGPALGLSRPTIHDAYDLLVMQGWLDRRSRAILPRA